MRSIRHFSIHCAGALASLVLSACVPAGADNQTGDDTNPLGRVCSAVLSVDGNIESRPEQPADVFGCWPVGVWRFQAKLEDNDCTAAPKVEPEYSFRVIRDADANESYEYLTDPNNERVVMKVTSGAGGLCEGGIEIYSADGMKVMNLKPSLNADGTIAGFGEYDEYKTDQYR